MGRYNMSRVSALEYAKKIVETSGFGIRGISEILGNMLVSTYCQGSITVVMYVTFSPALTTELQIKVHAAADQHVETAIGGYEQLVRHLSNIFQTWNVTAA
jgi:hypothetical protein